MARHHAGARRGLLDQPGSGVRGTASSRRHDQQQSIRLDVLHGHGVPRAARARRTGGAGNPVCPPEAGSFDRPPVRRARGDRILLALRRRRLDRGVLRHLPPGALMTTWQVISDLWYWRSPAWVIVLLATFIYTLAAVIRPVTRRQITCFVIAAATFLLALASPLAVLASQYSFSAHMMQHLLLLLIVPLCAILAWPSSPAVADGNATQASSLGMAALGWLAGVGAMWFWHVPALCTAAVQSSGVFAIQTCSLLVAG